MTTLNLRKSIGPECFRRFLLIPIALFCFALSPAAQAVLPAPSPDGAYPGNNTAEGQNALQSLTSGLNNAGIGFRALFKDTTGGNNTATGAQALFSNTTGTQNTASGYVALTSNTTGVSNTAIGAGALHGNTTASHNTATGYISLYNNTTGSFNVADGDRALYGNTTGAQNTATGYGALNSNTVGIENTANGYQALLSNTTGNNNTAVGFSAMASATGGSVTFNTAVGWNALVSTTANANVAVGDLALQNDTSGHFNVAIGAAAGLNQTTGSNNIYIGQGSEGVAGESNTCYIQEIYTNIQPVVGTDPDYVTINSSNKLGRGNVSSRRYKHDIKPMDKGSEAIFALKPVTFRYKPEYDATQTLAYGLIAEEVAEVYPDLVGRNPEGQPESVRYEQINAMLLNEFLKEHKRVEEQQASIAELKSTVAQQQKGMEVLTAQLKEQAAQIEKVSAQLEVSRSLRQVVVNKP